MVVSGMMASSTTSIQNQTSAAIPGAAVVSSTQAAVGGTRATVASNDAVNRSQKETSNPNNGIESSTREYFQDVPLMAEIAKCESRFRQFEKDGSTFRGIVNNKDVGVMQINEYYHLKRAKKLGIDIYTVEGNLKYGRLLYSEEGSDPWSSSAPCWMKSDVAKAMYGKKSVLAEK